MTPYYNRFSPAQNYKEIKFYPSRYIQSAELNELQAYIRDDYKNISSAVFEDGSILRGGNINLSLDVVTVEKSLIYANGYTISVPQREINIDLEAVVTIGSAVSKKIISSLEDVTLLDPAIATAGYKEEGGDRLQVNGRWCREDELEDGEVFYAVFTYREGILQSTKRIAPELEGARKIVARYDYDSNGSYVVDGLNTSFDHDDNDAGEHILSVEAGNGHVDGDELIFEYSQKVAVPFASDVQSTVAEPHTFNGDGEYILRHTPLRNVDRVVGIALITENVTHGSYTGVTDVLPHTPVVEILEIKQGTTTYVAGTDFVLNGDFLKWDNAVNEPAPSSTYSVKYKYQTHLENLEHTDNSITLNGLASGSSFYVNYDYYLTRRDRLILTRDGKFEILTGIADEFNPIAPKATIGLSLAEVEIKHNQNPIILLDYDKTVKMSELHTLFNRVGDIEYNVAKIELRNDAKGIDPTLNLREIFVDPFYDDDIRDLGLEQNAVIANKSLVPEINFTPYSFNFDADIALPYVMVGTLINQIARTDNRLINEFIEAPAPSNRMTLKPATYRWVANNTYYNTGHFTGVNTSTIVWSRSRVLGTGDSTKASVVPRIPLSIRAETFTNEIVDIYVDGKKAGQAQTILISDDKYRVDTTVTTPAGVVSGHNLVRLKGRTSGIVVEDVWVTVPQSKRVLLFWRDPLAQTILFDKDTFTHEFNLYIETLPITYIKLIICKTTVGEPDMKQTIFTQTYDADSLESGWHTFKCDSPVLLEAHQEYALIVESGDAVGRVATAKLGAFDVQAKKWVQKQPYAGVLLSSSNGSTWTAYQKEDLSLVVEKPYFYETFTKEIGRVNVENITDLYLMATSKLYVGTSVRYTATLTDRGNHKINLNEFSLTSFESYTGEIILSALLSTSSRDFTPIIDKDITLAVGRVSEKSTYISREFEVTGTKVDVYVDIKEQSEAVSLFSEVDGTFVPLVRDTSKNRFIGDGFVEMCFKADSLDILKTRFKIEITSTDVNRPEVKNMRGIIS